MSNKRYFVPAEHDKDHWENKILVIDLFGNVFGYSKYGNKKRKDSIGMLKSEILKEQSINHLIEISECEAALILNS